MASKAKTLPEGEEPRANGNGGGGAAGDGTLSSSSPQSKNQKQKQFVHSLSTVELFVYTFIPILKSINSSDLDNLKLDNGLKIWNALLNLKMFCGRIQMKQ